jgi:hypothetical protein
VVEKRSRGDRREVKRIAAAYTTTPLHPLPPASPPL